MPRCAACKDDLPREAFSPNSYRKNGLRPYCKECQKHRHRKKVRGIGKKKYLKLIERQKGRCAICRKEPNGRWKTLHVDHDHTTGKVRGLLCFTCNTSLGHFEKNRQRFEEYLGLARQNTRS